MTENTEAKIRNSVNRFESRLDTVEDKLFSVPLALTVAFLHISVPVLSRQPPLVFDSPHVLH